MSDDWSDTLQCANRRPYLEHPLPYLELRASRPGKASVPRLVRTDRRVGSGPLMDRRFSVSFRPIIGDFPPARPELICLKPRSDRGCRDQILRIQCASSAGSRVILTLQCKFGNDTDEIGRNFGIQVWQVSTQIGSVSSLWETSRKIAEN